MKKIILALVLIMIFPNAPKVLAESSSANLNNSSEKVTTSSSQAQGSAKEKLKYELPYPGILPDNPLYYFKAARDRIVSFLINDHLKKAEFNLLTSDKRLNASVFLADKKRYDLALFSISRSNNYFGEAINELLTVKQTNRDILYLVDKLNQSLQKRKLVMKDLIQKSDEQSKEGLIKEQERIKEFEKMIEPF